MRARVHAVRNPDLGVGTYRTCRPVRADRLAGRAPEILLLSTSLRSDEAGAERERRRRRNWK